MLKWKAILAVSAAVVVLAALQAQQQHTTGTLTALDYAEIEQLHGRYAIGFDTGNGDMYAGTFTSDGTFRMPGVGRTLVGRQQLFDMAAAPGANKGPTNVFHAITNITVNPSPEGATGTAYVLLVDIGKNGNPSKLSSAGIYKDIYVKTPEGWRIKQRTFLPAHSNLE